MTAKITTIILSILCITTLLLTPSLVYAHAGHSHSNGGSGCSDCTPPTLGLDEEGKRQVSGGITINDQTYDVGLFKQELETQTLQIGESVEITLKIYNDGGFNSLKHVELSLGQEDKFISGVIVPQHPVTIEWNQTFDGKTSIIHHNKQNFVKDIGIEVVDNSPIIGIKFRFTPMQEFDANTLVTKMWDMKRNSNTNYFHNALDIISNEPTFLLIDSNEYVSTLDFQETKTSKISDAPIDKINQNIQCNVGQERLLRTSNLNPICVDAYQAAVLIASNWAIPAH